MAIDDYFIVVYKILAYLYKCLKAGEPPDINNIITAETYGITDSYFEYIIIEMVNEGYIRGVTVFNVMGGLNPCARLAASLVITPPPKALSICRKIRLLKRQRSFLRN